MKIRLIVFIKNLLNLYTLEDVEFAMNTCGNATDRLDLERKLRSRLISMRSS